MREFVHSQSINAVRVNTFMVLRVVSWTSTSSCHFLIYIAFRAKIMSESVSGFSFWTRFVEKSFSWEEWAQVFNIFTVSDLFSSLSLLTFYSAEYSFLLFILIPKSSIYLFMNFLSSLSIILFTDFSISSFLLKYFLGSLGLEYWDTICLFSL